MSRPCRLAWAPALLLPLLGCVDRDHGRSLTPEVRVGADRLAPTASAELPLLSLPGQLALSPAGDILLVAQPELGRVLEIKVADNTTRVVTTTPASPWGVAWFPVLNRCLVSDPASRDLVLVDPVTGLERVATFPFQGRPGAAVPMPGGTKALVVCAEGFLAEVPLTGGQARRIDPLLDDPWGLALEPSGTTALTCLRGRGQLVRIDLAGGGVVALAAGLPDPTDLVLEPGGGSALVAGSGTVRRVDLASGGVTLLASLPGASSLALGRTPDELLVGDYGGGKVYAVSRMNGTGTVLAEGLGEPTWLAVAGSSRLAVVDQTPQGGLYRLDLDGPAARPRLLLEDGSDLASLAVEPGDLHAFVSTLAGQILQVPLAGGAAVVLAQGRTNPTALVSSPLGESLWFAERITGPAGAVSRLFALDLQSLRITELTPNLSLVQRLHALAPGQTGTVAVRDEEGLFLVDLRAAAATGYLLRAPSVTGLAGGWPQAWLAWSGGNPLEFQVYRQDLSALTVTTIASGQGLQPVGLALSRDRSVLYAADLAGAAVVRLLP